MKALCTSSDRLGATARLAGLLVALATVTSCGRGGDDGSSSNAPIPLSTLTPTQLEQAQRAGEARDSMFQSVIAELSEELEKGGPGEAIAVCEGREQALDIAGHRTGCVVFPGEIGQPGTRLRHRIDISR